MVKDKSQDYIEGASASINKTIEELMKIINGDKLSSTGKLRKKLRSTIEYFLINQGKRWYKKGINRGHKETVAALKKNRRIPSALRGKVTRHILPNRETKIKFFSRLHK